MSNKVNTLTVVLLATVLFVVCMPSSVDATSGNVFDYFNNNQQGEGPFEQQTTETTNTTWLFISALVKLVLATTFIVAIIYFGARFIADKRKSFQINQTMQNLGVQALGQNKTVQLIRVGKRVYILGVGENVNLIKELTMDESIEFLEQFNENNEQLDESNHSITNQFESIFKNRLSEFKKRNETPLQQRTESEREFL